MNGGRQHEEKMAISKPGKGASEEIHPADTLLLDIQPPEPWETTFLLFNPPPLHPSTPSLWDLVMVT